VTFSGKVGDIVELRNRLWRVDAFDKTTLTATKIDGDDAAQRRFYLPFEEVNSAHISPPDPDVIGQPALNRLLIQSYRYSLLHGSAPLLSLQRSSVIPTNYQLVPVVMALKLASDAKRVFTDFNNEVEEVVAQLARRGSNISGVDNVIAELEKTRKDIDLFENALREEVIKAQ
jgi:hypothetical protein